jgi:fatty acid desaturase 2 (delta-6 desaturase)
MGKGGNATAKADAKEVLIEGRFYDVSSFKHPGGSIINFLSGSGADATPTYREFHTRSKKADKYLKGLPNREATPAELSRALALNQLQPEQAGLAKAKKTSPLSDPAKVAALNADFDAFREQLVAEGFFKPSVAHIIYRVLEVALLWVMGTVLLLTDSLPLQAAGAVALSLSQGRCGWLMHEGGHYSMTGKINVDRRLQEVIYGFGCGMSGAWWRNQHNKHHATPQKLQHDVDLNTLPLMAFSRDAPHVASVKPGSLQALWLKYQAFLFFPVTSFLVGLGWTLFLHPKHAARTSRLVELTCMAARYVVFYLSFAPKYGALGALGIYMLTFATACNYIFINFSVSHTHLPVSAASDYLHWVVYSAVHTTNIKNTALCNWWMSYLNFQIEHHMFPSMPQFRHPTIAPRVKALFEKHGLVYDVRPYWGAMWDTFANLHEVGHHAAHVHTH